MEFTCRPCQRGDCVDILGACTDARCACCGVDVQPDGEGVSFT